MGVRWLDTFIREEVKNGAFLVNIEHEIRCITGVERFDAKGLLIYVNISQRILQ